MKYERRYHFLEGKVAAETASMVQLFNGIVLVLPSDSDIINVWSLILAYFFTGVTSKKSFPFFCSPGAFSIISSSTFDSNIHTQPCQTKRSYRKNKIQNY